MIDSETMKTIQKLSKDELSLLFDLLPCVGYQSEKDLNQILQFANLEELKASPVFPIPHLRSDSKEVDSQPVNYTESLYKNILALEKTSCAIPKWLESMISNNFADQQVATLEQIHASLARIAQYLLIFKELHRMSCVCDRLETSDANRYKKRRKKQKTRIERYLMLWSKGYNDADIYRMILKMENRTSASPAIEKRRLSGLKSWKSRMVKARLLPFENKANIHRNHYA